MSAERHENYENFELTHEDGIARLTIDSTTEMNSLNDRMTEELLDLATGLGADEDVRCIVLRGSGGVFCAGADISGFETGETAPELRKGASLLHDAVVQLDRAETPIVTGINGAAVGAGFSLAILGDIAVMSEEAYLQYGYPGVGLTGDGSSTFFLPRHVGLRKAKEIALLNERIPAGEAEEIDLVTEAVPDEEFDDRLAEVAGRIAEGPTVAFGRIKRLFDGSFDRSLEEQLALETDWIAETSKTDDYREGVTAFQEGRRPEFDGK